MMTHTAKGRLRSVLCVLFLFLLIQSTSGAYNKKLEITADKASVYIKPDTGSSVIGLLKRGDVVTLASSLKIKSSWYYIYFNLENSDFTSSGYIPDSAVKKLFSVTKVIVIDEGSADTNKYRAGSRLKNIRWGMNQEQVMINEGRPLDREDTGESTTLKYDAELMDRSCFLTYFFSEDNLTRAVYYFSEKDLEKTLNREDHNSIKNALIQKYGNPKEESVFGQYLRNRTHSIKNGGSPGSLLLLQTTCWEKAETRICLNLYQNKERIEIELEYTDLDHSKSGIKASSKGLSGFSRN